MVFEVDNTTERIIEKLQASVEGSIQGIHDGQDAVTKEISSLKGEMSQEEVLDSLRDVRKEIDDVSDKLRGVERGNEDTLASLDRISSSIKKINDNSEDLSRIIELLSDLSAKVDENQSAVKSLKEVNTKMSDNIDSVTTGFNEFANKIDLLISSTEKAEMSSAIQKEQLDRMADYLKKPGIVRLFSGMKGE